MGMFLNLSGQFQLGPLKLTNSPDVPCSFLERQRRLQDDHVLGPADGHGLCHHFRGILVSTVKVPHPAQVSGGEAGDIRIGNAQIFSGSHRRALLRPATDQTANLTVQLHLRQTRRHQRVQRGVQGAVISGFFDIHGLLFSSAGALVLWNALL